jgi:hypothetical protein
VRKELKYALLIGAVAVAAAPAYPLFLSAGPRPWTGGPLLTEGSVAYYAYGSAVAVPMNLSSASRLTGGFATNASLVFYVFTSDEYSSQRPAFEAPILSYYSTGDVRGASINLTLPQGDYWISFRFVNDTGRWVATTNGTGSVSTTEFLIIKSFQATPTP